MQVREEKKKETTAKKWAYLIPWYSYIGDLERFGGYKGTWAFW